PSFTARMKGFGLSVAPSIRCFEPTFPAASDDGQDGWHWRFSQAPGRRPPANLMATARRSGAGLQGASKFRKLRLTRPRRKLAGANRNEQDRGGTHEAHPKVRKPGARRQSRGAGVLARRARRGGYDT